jgi:RNase P subunit RPR2
MFDPRKIKFLFRCKECQMILSVELEDEIDLKEVREDKMYLECPCGSRCYVLRD